MGFKNKNTNRTKLQPYKFKNYLTEKQIKIGTNEEEN